MDDELHQLQEDLDALMAELVSKVALNVSFAEYARLRERERAIRRKIMALEKACATRPLC